MKLSSKFLKKVKLDGRSVSEVAREFAIAESTIYYWVKLESSTSTAKRELFIIRKLEEKLKKISMEKEALIKAVSIFASRLSE